MKVTIRPVEILQIPCSDPNCFGLVRDNIELSVGFADGSPALENCLFLFIRGNCSQCGKSKIHMYEQFNLILKTLGAEEYLASRKEKKKS